MGREPILHRISPLTSRPCDLVVLCGISTPFNVLSPCVSQVAHALLTRPPLKHLSSIPKDFQPMSPLDLHVLGTPPAFVLSQNQTLLFILLSHRSLASLGSLALSRSLALQSHALTIGSTLTKSTVSFAFLLPCSCIVFKVLSHSRQTLVLSEARFIYYQLSPSVSTPFPNFLSALRVPNFYPRCGTSQN